MAKLLKDGQLIYVDNHLSRLDALSQGFKDLIERKKPDNYTSEQYNIVFEDTLDGIIEKYELINHKN